MANISVYLEALIQFEQPATAAEVHDKSKAMFGDAVRGDRTSCRLSLDRYVATGKVEKRGNKYLATQLAYDPIGAMATKIRVLEAQNEALKKEVARLNAERANDK